MIASSVQLVVCDVDGTLTDGVIGLDERGEEFKHFSVVDGLGIALLIEAGIDVAFLSARKSGAVRHRAEGLGVSLCWDGVREKRPHLETVLEKRGIDAKNVCFVGDDLNDLPCLRLVGFPVAVANARPEVKEHSVYVTEASGGHGAVREVAELVLEARGLWKPLLEKYL